MHFSEYLSSEVVKYHASVVPALLGVINMETNVRVMEKQVIGLSLYCGYLEDQIAPYVQHIMTKAGQIYKGAADDVHLKCAAVSLMKAVAQASGAKFEPYAQNSLNLCAQVMEMKQDGILDLRQQATDFVSVLCTAVGPEKFAPYFETFMQLGIMSLQLEYFQLNSSTYTMFGTFAEAYKANLTNLNNRNYTDVIFELCVTTLVSYDGMTIKQRKAAFDDNGNDEDEDIVDSDSDDDDQMVTYHVENGYMDEKKAALLCISCLLQHVGEYLLMKFDTLIKVFPILLEYPHPPVRNICVDTIKDLLEVVYKKYNTTGTEAKKLGHRENLPENVGYMLEHMMPLILSKIIKETCWETMADAMKTLQSIMGWWGFSAIEKYVQHLLPQIHLILSKKHACFEDDYDRDFALDMQVHDYILMDATFDLIGCLAYTCGAAFDPALKEYFPYILQFSDKKRHEQDRAMAIGLISDAFDHGNGDAQRLAPFLPAILPLLSSTLRDESASVRRNATFCCGVMYMRAGPAIAQAIPELLPLLVNLVAPCDTKKDNPTDNKFGISDNALSAIVKMAFTCPQQVPIEQILGKMLVGMPLRNDVMESKYVMAYFVQLFETKPQLMMSQQILPQCVSILAQVLGVQQSGIDMPLMLKLQAVAKGIAQSQQQALQQILQQLPQAHAQNFLSAIQ
jgi:hypothetical protein